MRYETARTSQFLTIALCAIFSTVTPSPAAEKHQPAVPLRQSARHQQRLLYTMNVTDAHAFEQSYKAHPSVLDDPFYTVPQGTTNASAGTLLKLENSTDTSLYTLPPNLSLSRFIYQSKTSSGALVPVSAYILWPYAARPYHGGYPVVVWAHGTSGSAPECAPSNIQNLWHNFQAPYQLALYGFVVIATDYAGLGVASDAAGKPIVHEYIMSPAQANDLFYSIPAARQAFPELSQEFVVIGQSQGGGAAWAFAQKLATEPLTGHLGTVALCPATRLFDLPPEEPIIPLVLINLVPNLRATYPEFKPEDIFTSQGLQSLQTATELQGCSTVIYQLIGPDSLKPGWQNNTSIQKFEQSSVNGGQEISGPMLIIQGGADPVVQTPNVEAAIKNTITKFPDSQIEYHLLPNVTHAPVQYAGLPIYIDWITSRFAGNRVDPGYHSSVATLARPASTQQPETNWFIQKQLQPYQMT